MSDKGNAGDEKLNYFKTRIESAFPKLVGAKLDKLLVADDVK